MYVEEHPGDLQVIHDFPVSVVGAYFLLLQVAGIIIQTIPIILAVEKTIRLFA